MNHLNHRITCNEFKMQGDEGKIRLVCTRHGCRLGKHERLARGPLLDSINAVILEEG